MTATDKVQLLKSAVQLGDIKSPTFSIEEGAYFKGFADMGLGPSADESLQDIDAQSARPIQHDATSPRLPEETQATGT